MSQSPSINENKAWPMVRLGDVCIVQRGVRVTRKDLNESGKYNVFQNSLKPLGRFDSFNCDANNPFVIMALAAGDIGFSEEPFWAADDCTYFKELKNLDSKYLYFSLLQNRHELRRNVKQATIPRLANKFLENLAIPFPPLSVQRAIVARLEKELTEVKHLAANFKRIAERADDEFKAELEETFKDVEGKKVRLGELGRVAMCKRVLKGQTSETGAVPFFKIGTFGKKADAFISQELFDDFSRNYSYPNRGDILISAAGTIGRTVVFDGTPSYFQDSNIVWLKHDGSRLLNAYLRYFYRLKPWEVSVGVTIPRIYNGDIERTEIPLPTLSTQRAVVAKLDAAKARCEKLKAAAEKGLQGAEKLRAAILAEAFE